ncbi:hypothetical protein Sme01_22180 [Sphaerisporangium melleum]|uniref:Uncharacterized protein n=1 Tax=Sphaerisporangium melleum TaxID=321316 RepID=A0A917QZA2_9ACTN|nr:SigE family RNA polymerase sigma factor [Sphaerisporangium melleum]GGK79129.1 hypothetical protein GCM10007964_22190 [Sphaerisporangium melleum]GII69742.1 hypothetical protein Sme01_22180 [Sphaerisporangium melleum]
MDYYEGFREFVNARQQVLMRTAYLLTGDAHLAEDLLQTVLAKVARHWAKLAKDGNPEAYTRRCLINEFVSWRRQRRWYVESPDAHPPDAQRSDHGESDTLHRIALREALAKLAPRQRAVVVLRFYEDRTVQETAEMLGCSPGTVKSQTSHALDRLRALAPELAGLLSEVDPAHDAGYVPATGPGREAEGDRARGAAERRDRADQRDAGDAAGQVRRAALGEHPGLPRRAELAYQPEIAHDDEPAHRR